MLSIFRKTALVSAALSLALIGATAPASAQIRSADGGGGIHVGGGGGGFSGGGAFHGGFNGGAPDGGGAFHGGFNGGFNSGAVRSAPMIENRSALVTGGFGTANRTDNPGFARNFTPNGAQVAPGDRDWSHHHHHHHHFFGGGFAPFAFYGGFGYPYYDSGYDYDYSYDTCIEYRRVYDRYGRYLGRRPVNVC